MVRTLKVAMLSLLLVASGIAGAAQLVCSAPTGMQTASHACCAGHHGMRMDMRHAPDGFGMDACQRTIGRDDSPSCCKVKPAIPNPVQTVYSAAQSSVLTVELTSARLAGTILPLVVIDRGRLTGHLSKDLNSHTRASLCSFLI